MRPTESGTRCSFAVKRSLRFIALTCASLSSWVPAPTCEPAPAGPHCFGGGTLVDVRRPCVGLRRRVLLDSRGSASTVAAMSCIADHELPNNPDRPGELGLFEFADRSNSASGFAVPPRRDAVVAPARELAAGDAFLEAVLEGPRLKPPSLPCDAYTSSSTEISLLVRGRSVELLFDVDNDVPLEGFMACGRRAEWVMVELHRPDDLSGREDAWHGITASYCVWWRAADSKMADWYNGQRVQ